MAARWSPGIWLGKNQASDENLVWSLTGERLKSARTVRFLNEEITIDHVRSVDCRPIEIASGFKVRHVQPIPAPVPREEAEQLTPRAHVDPPVFDPVGSASS